uniref:Tetratricopeptide repeat domain 28 n=1 Tax=Oryzias latipes TaxID=8090 RepID=A0A3P9MHN7_ORYLA
MQTFSLILSICLHDVLRGKKLRFGADLPQQFRLFLYKVFLLPDDEKSVVSLGHVYTAIGDYPNALASHKQCVLLARQDQCQLTEARQLGNMGAVYTALGDFNNAVQCHEPCPTTPECWSWGLTLVWDTPPGACRSV